MVNKFVEKYAEIYNLGDMKVKKNDTVLILTGKDAGKTGKVLEVFPKTNKVKVEGINIQKKIF